MTESAAENQNETTQSKSSSSSLDVFLIFHLKNGTEIKRSAKVKPEKFEEFKDGVIRQIVEKKHDWFYFLESEKPHMATMIRIEDVSTLEILEQIVISKDQMKILSDKLRCLAKEKEGE